MFLKLPGSLLNPQTPLVSLAWLQDFMWSLHYLLAHKCTQYSLLSHIIFFSALLIGHYLWLLLCNSVACKKEDVKKLNNLKKCYSGWNISMVGMAGVLCIWERNLASMWLDIWVVYALKGSSGISPGGCHQMPIILACCRFCWHRPSRSALLAVSKQSEPSILKQRSPK